MAGYVSDVSFPSDDDEEIINYLQRPMRRPRVVRNRQEYYDSFDDLDFLKRFRISKASAMFLLTQIEDSIRSPSDKNDAISPMNRLLLTLRFYASGCHLVTAGDFIGVNTSSACRIVHQVTDAIAALRPQFINLPTDHREMRAIQQKFYELYRFPRVLGAMDCTHVRIQSPGGNNAELFRNRKCYFSINVQTISDADLLVRDIVARWPGSVHDTTIFNNCEKRAMFEAGEYGNGVLLVDGGYPVRPYLMPPLDRAITPAQQLYNESQIRTRNCVERKYGIMKRMFPILSLGMRVQVHRALDIIVACAVIYNLARRNGDDLPPNEFEDLEPEDIIADNQPVGVHNNVRDDLGVRRAGEYVRNQIITEHFERLL